MTTVSTTSVGGGLALLVHGGGATPATTARCCCKICIGSSQIVIENYSQNLWGHSIRTLFHLRGSDAEEFLKLVNELTLNVGTSLFPFEETQGALILAKHGQLEKPNAVIKIADSF